MKISVKKGFGSCFQTDEYVIDLNRKFEGYEVEDLIIYGKPFDSTDNFPLLLILAIRRNGKLAFRNWQFTKCGSCYFHTDESDDFVPTLEQMDTVAGLFSGRVKFEGLKLAIGKTILDLCPINIKEEERKIGRKIFLA